MYNIKKYKLFLIKRCPHLKNTTKKINVDSDYDSIKKYTKTNSFDEDYGTDHTKNIEKRDYKDCEFYDYLDLSSVKKDSLA